MTEPEQEEPGDCEHLSVKFDANRAKRMDKGEVRAKYPRFEGTCSCGYKGIAYASYGHYLYGDW